jgi:hypothetical protein
LEPEQVNPRLTNFSKRRRRLLTSITLGSWLFAFFIATVHACGLYAEENGRPSHETDALAATATEPDDDPSPGCEEFCATAAAAPVSKVQAVLKAERSPDVLLHSFSRAHCGMRRTVTAELVRPRPSPLPDIDLNIRFVRFAL